MSNDRYNASSLAFILETPDFKGLFLGDAWPSVIKTSLDSIFNDFPVTFDLIKVSHHGSHYNTTKYLMELINSEHYVVSTDSSRFGHPDIEAIAKIICAPQRLDKKIKLWFNYQLEHISKVTNSQEDIYKFKCEFDKQIIEWKETC